MKNGLFCIAAALAVICMLGGSVVAEEGVPSQAKLAKLGLSSMNVASDEQGHEVRGAAIAIVGGQFLASTTPPGFGIFGFGFPFGGIGGGGVFQHATAIDGEAPNYVGDAFAAIGTLDPSTQLPGPIVVETNATFNGFAGLSRTTVSGGVFAASGINIFNP